MSGVLQFSYDGEGWGPPAPVLAVELAYHRRAPHGQYRALLDTGADMTVVPSAVARELDLVQVSEIAFEAFREGRKLRRLAPVFSLHVRLPEPLRSGNVEVMLHDFAPNERYVVFGRDLLNRWRIVLDGVRLLGEVRD